MLSFFNDWKISYVHPEYEFNIVCLYTIAYEQKIKKLISTRYFIILLTN
jgi:hypothetical protein